MKVSLLAQPTILMRNELNHVSQSVIESSSELFTNIFL